MNATATPLHPLNTDAEIEALPGLNINESMLLDDLRAPFGVVIGVRQILAARGVTQVATLDATKHLRPLGTDTEIEALPSLHVDETMLLDDLALRSIDRTCPLPVFVGVRQILAAHGITD